LTLPTRLKATFHEKIWGSTELEPWFPRSQEKIGEVWFTDETRLPVLVKFLFTADKLSVQVHPDGPQGKTEMWHILRAEPDAKIALGFREPISRQRLIEAARSGEIESLLQWLPVKAGETYFTPAHTVHAIGGGIALCEIQQNSDITYRLYDYGRARELHVEQAAAIADLGIHPGPVKPEMISPGRELLVGCDYFETELLAVEKSEYAGYPERDQFLIFLEGRGRIADLAYHAGDVWLIAPEADRFWLVPEATSRALRVLAPVRT
jgi:mannose-6-phosphate isomerase